MEGAGALPPEFNAFVLSLESDAQRAFAGALQQLLLRQDNELQVLRRVVGLVQQSAPGAAQPQRQDGARQVPEPLPDVPRLLAATDIAYDEKKNPVKRVPWEQHGFEDDGEVPADLDLSMDPRFRLMVSNPALRFEYEHWGPLVSWLHDGMKALELQARAGDIPQARRESLDVVRAWLGSAYEYSIKMLDYLVGRAELQNAAPSAVAALKETIFGSARRRMVSSSGQATMDAVRAAQIQQLAKQGAKELAASGAKSGNRGPEANK